MEIINILLVVIFGIPAYFFLFKKKKTALYFIKDRQINLQDDLLKNFDNLTITYNNVEINDKITFIKGHILCVGNKDIVNKSNKIEIYANEILWLDFKITKTSKDLNVEFVIKNEKVILEFGLLKDGESFEFECILNNNVKDRELKLNFFHRIPNLYQIEEFDKSKYKNNFRNFSLSILNNILSIGLIIMMSITFRNFNLETFDSKSNKLIANSILVSPDYYNNLLEQVNNDYSIHELYLHKSKDYKLKVIDPENHKKHTEMSVYFKKPKDFMFVFFLMVLLVAMVSIVMTLIQLKKVNQRKYFKKIEDSYSNPSPPNHTL